jgi:hypothetical protein
MRPAGPGCPGLPVDLAAEPPRGSARQLAERPSITLAFQTAAGGEVLLADADTYGGAVAHATMQERLGRPSRLGMPEVPADVGWLPLA